MQSFAFFLNIRFTTASRTLHIVQSDALKLAYSSKQVCALSGPATSKKNIDKKDIHKNESYTFSSGLFQSNRLPKRRYPLRRARRSTLSVAGRFTPRSRPDKHN